MIKRYFEARKTVDSIKEGEYETNKIHVIELENEKVLKYFYDLTEDNDDYESLFWDGFGFGWEELQFIDVDKVLKFMERRLREMNEEGSDYEKGFIQGVRDNYNWLYKYQGYSFTIKQEQVPTIMGGGCPEYNKEVVESKNQESNNSHLAGNQLSKAKREVNQKETQLKSFDNASPDDAFSMGNEK